MTADRLHRCGRRDLFGIGSGLDARRTTLIATGAAMFMGVMDTQIVNVALPPIARGFGSGITSVQWVVTAYALTVAVFMPASGWVGDSFGTKRTFLAALAIFTTTSALCAVSPSLPILIVTRAVQGAGGGMLTPVGLAMVYRAYGQSERIGVAKTVTLIMVFAPASAPLIGGALVSALSWRFIFLVNVPIGLAVLAYGWIFLGEYRCAEAGPYDLTGLLLGGPGLALVLYGLSNGPVVGWLSPGTVAEVVGGCVLLACFARGELRRAQPMLDLRLLVTSRLFRWCSLLSMCQPVTFVGSLLFTSLYVQETRGYSALVSGTATFPEAIAIGVSSPLVARLYPRVGPRRLVALGFTLLVVGAAMLAHMGAHTSLWFTRGSTFVLGLGTSCVVLPLQTAAYAEISDASTGQASAIYNTCGRIGMPAGVAVLSTVLAGVAGQALHPSADALRDVFLTAVGFALLGFAGSWAVSDAAAAPTMTADRGADDP